MGALTREPITTPLTRLALTGLRKHVCPQKEAGLASGLFREIPRGRLAGTLVSASCTCLGARGPDTGIRRNLRGLWSLRGAAFRHRPASRFCLWKKTQPGTLQGRQLALQSQVSSRRTSWQGRAPGSVPVRPSFLAQTGPLIVGLGHPPSPGRWTPGKRLRSPGDMEKGRRAFLPRAKAMLTVRQQGRGGVGGSADTGRGPQARPLLLHRPSGWLWHVPRGLEAHRARRGVP